MPEHQDINWEVSISGHGDGMIEAVYIRVLDSPVAETREINGDVLLADYDSCGRLVGVELLAQAKVSDLLQLVHPAERDPFKSFVEKALPRELLVA